LRNKHQNTLPYKSIESSGFTLIELLVVIAIIGLLASVVLLALNSARQKARDSKRVADVRQIQTALELYYNDFSGYPAQASAGKITTGGSVLSALVPTYMGGLPTSPIPADTNACSAANGSFIWNDYVYTSAASDTYALTFCLGGVTGGFQSGVHTASPAGVN